jgi:mannosyl-3-phosphoglycerate phosphatase
LQRTSIVVYCAVDAFVASRGNIKPGFEKFSNELEHAGVPIVWVTNRSRTQLDEARRKFGHNHPFIAEGGCGVYLPEDYFHLRASKMVRLGRFVCVPIAAAQPAASEALESFAQETGVSVVSLRSLSPREFAQNSGLRPREAELARQRDFEELFFFAGAAEKDLDRFLTHAQRSKVQVRQRGAFWSLAVGSSLGQCLRDLSSLYDRAIHVHATTFGLGLPDDSDELLAACDRGILLCEPGQEPSPGRPRSPKIREIPFSRPDVWAQLRAMIVPMHSHIRESTSEEN